MDIGCSIERSISSAVAQGGGHEGFRARSWEMAVNHDARLFGSGLYPPDGPFAILGRLAFIGSALAIILAVLLPPERVPNFVYSHHLQHFAAFYVLTLCGGFSFPQVSMSRLGIGVGLFASALEGLHIVAGAPPDTVFDAWLADVGGSSAALAPMLADRFRRRLRMPDRPS